jgi:hypothetical protein
VFEPDPEFHPIPSPSELLEGLKGRSRAGRKPRRAAG